MPDKKLEWNFNAFIDVCHAGSCIDRATEWANNNRVNNYIDYFDNNCELEFKIYCSCLANEMASDCGSLKGGIWLNHFIK